MKRYLLEVVVEKDREGYFAYCPILQGCYTQGSTYEEAIKNIRDAIRLHLQDRKHTHQTLPSQESISVTTLEMAV